MEAYMELSKKTTILFSPDLYAHLERLAEERSKSLGQLVREACVERYGFVSRADRLAAVEALGRLRLPVGTVEQIKRECVPDPKPLPGLDPPVRPRRHSRTRSR